MTQSLSKPGYERIVVVTRRTDLEDLLLQFSTIGQARFVLDHSGTDFSAIQAAHEIYQEALLAVRRAIPKLVKCHVIDRDLVPQYSFAPEDLIVTLGQDGLVSNTAKYLDGQPILAVNPNPALYDGVLLAYSVESFASGLGNFLKGRGRLRPVTLAQVETSDGQSLLAFNDFFIGSKGHVSARYDIAWRNREEQQSSSGIVVSTGAGSTGWMRSVFTGAANLAKELSGQDVIPENAQKMPWDSEALWFAVREPFSSHVTGTDLSFGRITPDMPLAVRSRMAVDGVIFSDGVEADYIAFHAGLEAKITLAAQKAQLAAP